MAEFRIVEEDKQKRLERENRLLSFLLEDFKRKFPQMEIPSMYWGGSRAFSMDGNMPAGDAEKEEIVSQYRVVENIEKSIEEELEHERKMKVRKLLVRFLARHKLQPEDLALLFPYELEETEHDEYEDCED